MYAVGYKQVPAMLAGQFHHPRVQSSTETPTEIHAERVHPPPVIKLYQANLSYLFLYHQISAE